MVDMDLGEVAWFIKMDELLVLIRFVLILIDIVETFEYEMICRQKRKNEMREREISI